MADHTRPTRRRRTAGLVGATVALAGLGLWFGAAGPAHADAPVKDGWWTDLDQGTLDGSPALGVPSGGLQVSNGPGGPTAISAVTFSVPDGSSVGDLKLTITGNPVVTSPPVACAISANSLNYQPAQGGAMSSAPTPDCTTTVTATEDAASTYFTFPAAKFQANGQVAMVIEAGGPADSITFAKPDDNALTVTPPPADSGSSDASLGAAPTDASSSAPAPAASTGASSAPAPAAAATSGGSSFPSSSTSPVAVAALPSSTPAADAGSTTPAVASLPAASAPAAAAPAQPAGSAAAPAQVKAKRASATHPSHTRKSLASVLGIAAVLAALVAYSEGYGILGGRLRGVGSGMAGARAGADGEPAAGNFGTIGGS